MRWRLHRRVGGLGWREAGDRRGPAIALLHGFFQDSRAWSATLKRLPADEVSAYHWIAIDLPGHGASRAVQLAALGQAAWPALGTLLDDALDAALGERPGPVGVIGYSFGGRAAAWWLNSAAVALSSDSQLPQRGLAGRGVAWAVLESAHPGLPAELAGPRRLQDCERGEAVRTLGVEAFERDWANLALFASQRQLPAAVLRAQRRIRLQQSPLGLADHLLSLGSGAMPALDRPPAPPWPIALLVGAQDSPYVALLSRWQQAWPHATARIIDGAGHNVHLEQPEAWWRAVRAQTAAVAGDPTRPV